MRIDRAMSGSRIWIVTLAGALMFCAPLPGQDQPPQPQLNDWTKDTQFEGKEPIDGVYVRDPAGASDKWALAKRMEGLKEWNKSADLLQEILTKYADRVVPSRLDQPEHHRASQWRSSQRGGRDIFRQPF